MAASIVEGLEVSPTFRLVADRVATLKGIVYIHVQPGTQRAFSGALLHSVTPLGDYRVLHVRIAPEPGVRRVSILAHELQHAIEVLESGAMTEAAIDLLFERIGTPSGVGMTETKAATETERRVLREMSAALIGPRPSNRSTP